jgi:two-component system, OmpR family, response regulator
MNETSMWRCLVIEDDVHNARYIADGFRALGHVAVICNDGASALARATGESWDLVILDRMLPNDVDGLAILAAMRGLGKKTPVLVLSALSALDERVRGLKAGGDDYLTKPFAFSELAARAEALVRRSRPGPEIRVLQFADVKLDLAARQVERGGRLIALQPREFRLLAYFMSHPGQVLTRTMLLEAVWDYQFDPQTNVIDVQVSRLRGKLDAGGARPLIQTVRGIGYRMSADDGDEGAPPAAGPQ